jgi:CHAD domain-containing protein
MSFRVRPTESIADGLRRLARQELRSISEHLDDAVAQRADAIHEIRKSVKKTRAILGILEADHGRKLVRSEKRLHAINRRLSALRDADAMLETLQVLRTRDRRIVNEQCFARVQRRLTAHSRAVKQSARRQQLWRRVGRGAREIRRDAGHWTPKHRQFGCLAPGIRLTHQRGAKAMTRARKSHAAGDFHELRKHVKALWYELRLLEDCSPRIRQDVEALRHAEEWLGADHDVVVLCDALSHGARAEHRFDLERVRVAAARYQRQLRARTFASIRRVYSRSPRGYVNAVGGDWKKCHREAAAGDSSSSQLQ